MKISGKPREDIVKIIKDICQRLGVNFDFNLVFAERRDAQEFYREVRGVPKAPPAYAYISKEGPVLVLIPELMDKFYKKGDSYEDQLFDEILHLKCFQDGWMDPDIAAFLKAEQYFERISSLSIRKLDLRFLGQFQRHLTNFIGEEMAVKLGYKDRILEGRKKFLNLGVEFASENWEFKLPHSFAPVSHAFMLAYLVTLPPSYPEREEIEKKELLPRAEVIVQELRQDIREKFTEIKAVFSSMQSPPNEENLLEMYKKAILIYVALS